MAGSDNKMSTIILMIVCIIIIIISIANIYYFNKINNSQNNNTNISYTTLSVINGISIFLFVGAIIGLIIVYRNQSDLYDKIDLTEKQLKTLKDENNNKREIVSKTEDANNKIKLANQAIDKQNREFSYLSKQNEDKDKLIKKQRSQIQDKESQIDNLIFKHSPISTDSNSTDSS